MKYLLICFCLAIPLLWGITNWLTFQSIKDPVRAFYFWENEEYSLSDYENEVLDTLSVQKLYVKLFEVEKNEVMGIFPSAKSDLQNRIPESSIELIPVVYIRNDVFKKVSDKELEDFAENFIYLVEKRFEENFGREINELKEIQIDCDWTESTKEAYFKFLKLLRSETTCTLSATLRLYAYKFPNRMGILPVDRAMLMCYNLMSPLEAENRNSILDLNELSKYLIGADNYPVPLDVALPIYSSIQVYQNNTFAGMFYQEDSTFLKSMKHTKGLWYYMTNDTVVQDIFIRIGDELKFEKTSPKQIRQAIELICEHVYFKTKPTVALFHLQEQELKQHTYEELDSYFTSFDN